MRRSKLNHCIGHGSATESQRLSPYVVAPVENLVPFNVTLVEARVAAAVMLQGMIAHYLTRSTFPLQEDQTALVHAAAGGVGSCSSSSPGCGGRT